MTCPMCKKEVELIEAIGGEEIIRICRGCAIKDNLPIISKPSTVQLKESEKPYSVYERMVKLSGADSESIKAKIAMETLRRHKKTQEKVKQEQETPESKLDLILNYHWYIRRARIKKSLSQKQLAKAIGEAEIAINMIEKANLTSNPEVLIKKLEQFLELRLRKHEEVREKKEVIKVLSFDQESLKNITISDLQEIKKQRESLLKEKQTLEQAEQEIEEIQKAPHLIGEEIELEEEEFKEE